MALNLLLDGWVTRDRLDRRFVLLHHCSAAVLGRQRPVAGRSDLVARLGFDWAIRLTRHPRSMLEVLPFGSWSGVPATDIVSGRPSHFAEGCLSCTHNLNDFPLVASERCLDAPEDLSKTLHFDGSG